jgi:hypothetical protein
MVTLNESYHAGVVLGTHPTDRAGPARHENEFSTTELSSMKKETGETHTVRITGEGERTEEAC